MCGILGTTGKVNVQGKFWEIFLEDVVDISEGNSEEGKMTLHAQKWRAGW